VRASGHPLVSKGPPGHPWLLTNGGKEDQTQGGGKGTDGSDAGLKDVMQAVCLLSNDNSACDALSNASMLYGACACFSANITAHVTVSNIIMIQNPGCVVLELIALFGGIFASILATLSMCATRKSGRNDGEETILYAMAPV
jgi:hypothetical protein